VEIESELLDDFDLKETGNILADFIMSKVGWYFLLNFIFIIFLC
jgi:hypothetical protein